MKSILATITAVATAVSANATIIVLDVSGNVSRAGLVGSGFNATESMTGTVRYDTTSTPFQTGTYGGTGSYAYYRPVSGSFTVAGRTYSFNTIGAVSVIDWTTDSISFFQQNPTGPVSNGFTPTYVSLQFDRAGLVPNTGLPQSPTTFQAANRPYFQLWFNGAFTQGLTGFVNLTSARAVPEPATWAMMIVGFGAIGSALRRRRLGVAFT